MEVVLEYIKKAHNHLKNKYNTLDGNGIASCNNIANDIYNLLCKEGRTPRILLFRGKLLKNNNIIREELVPKMYKGSIKWKWHCACCCEDLIYDPILEYPTNLKDYLKKVFGKVYIETGSYSSEAEENDSLNSTRK